MEIRVVCEYKYLLDEVPCNEGVSIVRIVPTDFDHLSDQCAYDKQSLTVHTGNGIVDYNDFILELSVCI